MYASEVKKLLTAFLEAERDVDNQLERLNILSERIYSVGSPKMSDMPKDPSPAGDRLAEMISRKLEQEEKVRKIAKLQSERRAVYEDIAAEIREPDKRAVIVLRYLEGAKWERINESLFSDCEDFDDRRDSYMRRVMRLHGWALQEMARIIDSNAGYQMRIRNNEDHR